MNTVYILKAGNDSAACQIVDGKVKQTGGYKGNYLEPFHMAVQAQYYEKQVFVVTLKNMITTSNKPNINEDYLLGWNDLKPLVRECMESSAIFEMCPSEEDVEIIHYKDGDQPLIQTTFKNWFEIWRGRYGKA